MLFTKEHVYRAIAVCDYILEDGGHTVKEASKVFGICVQNIRRDIQIVAICAHMTTDTVYETSITPKELAIKYCKVKKTLDLLAKKNHYRPKKTTE